MMAKKKKELTKKIDTTPANESVISFAIMVDGKFISDTYAIISIEVEKNVNQIPVARIVISDGDTATGQFDVSSSETFVPGANITVEAGYRGDNNKIFEGIITQQSIKINRKTGSTLLVECRDKAIKMSVGRNSSNYSTQKDSDIISSLIDEHGLDKSIASTATVWPQQIQYYVTDWDFLLSRAEASGMVVIVSDGKVTVAAPDADSNSVLTIEYGNNLLELNADLNAVNQLRSVTASAWDFTNQAINSGEAANTFTGAGNLSTNELAEVIDLQEYKLQTSAALKEAELENWSKAQLVKAAYSKIRGKVKISGYPVLIPGKHITLEGVGNRFEGDHFVSGVTQTLKKGNWITEINFGLNPEWLSFENTAMAPPASGLLPGACGLFQGTVKQLEHDPENQYRILVNVPLMDNNNEGVWARLSNFYATDGAGSFFLPEIDDEVIIGFLNEDPRFPIILGSMYSNDKHKPSNGLEPSDENNLKAIVSRSGISLQFDDERKELTLTTPAQNVMTFSDDAQEISIVDQNGNSIKMQNSGITMKSAGDINIEADGNVNINGSQGIDIQSDGKVEVIANSILESASNSYEAKAGGSLKLTGSLININ